MQHRKLWMVVLVLALILAVGQTALAGGRSEPAPLLAVDSPSAIPGEYIVVFQPGSSGAEVNAAAEHARGRGANINFVYDEVFLGFAASLPEQALNGLLRNPNVLFIEADQVMTADTTQSGATWGLDRIDQRALPLNGNYNYTNTGAGVTAYIIDTGILFSHQEFGGRADKGYDSFGGNGSDCHGHGTHVAGTVGGETYGVAKDVTLKAVRVLNCSGSGTTSGVIAGVNWVASNHQSGQPAVANMSLGGNKSTSLDNAVAAAIADGVTFAVSAGNEGLNACTRSPARVATALTVGATDSTDTKASWSNYGSCLDLFAPGVSITSAWYSITSTTGTNTISGTSMASPHVAGVAALYLQSNTTALPSVVSSAVVGSTTPGVVKNPGVKSPNKLLYTNY